MIAILAGSAALLLAVAGVAKLLAPQPSVTMLVTAWPHLRRRRGLLAPLVRLAGGAELLTGATVLIAGGRLPAALLAAAYLVFTIVAGQLLRRARGTSCGCFGSVESPVGVAHLLVDVACVAVAVAATADPIGRLAGLADAAPTVLTTGLAQLALLAGLAYLSITALPALSAARRRVEDGSS